MSEPESPKTFPPFDGDRLLGTRLPSVRLPSSQGGEIDVGKVTGRWTAVCCYPGDGLGLRFPDLRGCTPEACGLRDAHARFQELGVSILSVSTQTPEHQREFARLQNLPYPILSDRDLRFARALKLPTVVIEDHPVLQRLTVIADRTSRIRRIVAPVLDPAGHAEEILGLIRDLEEP